MTAGEAGRAYGAEARLQAVLKAVVVGAATGAPASTPAGESDAAFAEAGALAPPYDPYALCLLFEHSNALRQNVDAYATNIDGFGHRLEPAIDFNADDADERLVDCLFVERFEEKERGALPPDAPLEPSPEELAHKKRELRQLARVERARLESFFDACAFDHSFVDLRRRTRQDLEVTGNAYWEVLRDGRGEVCRLVYVPAHTVRLLPLDPEPVEVEERVRVSPVTFERVRARRHLRRLVQVQNQRRAYFKAFGDPRAVSAATGRAYASAEALAAERPGDALATEMLHFRIPSPRSPYGVPRWVGALLSVLGSRQMEEVNYLYFDNKSVPPLALLVSGGRLSDASVPRIERFIEENLKGKNNFHKILILEAEGGEGGSNAPAHAKIELKPLTDAQQQDALFQVYDERNLDKVGGAFRLPRLLRGDSRDFNRSVADAQLRFAEDQVFQPERDEFDFVMNRTLLAAMGIRFWRFRSQTPVTRDPERLTDMVEKLVRAGVLTPEEARVLASDVFNRELRKLGEAWTKQPITLTLAGIQSGSSDAQGARPAPSLVDDAKRLLALREELAAEEARLAERRMALAREAMARPETRPEPASLDAASAPPAPAPSGLTPLAGGRLA
ncbi:MAG TPA: phage portal protein [Polyangiaceae bacterium]|nr:phage portal protein [Polyangiaceae bacterium]